MRKIVLIETKSSHIHVYSDVPIPRLGTVLLGTILRNLGYEVKVFIEEFQDIDFSEVYSADLVGISTITSTAPRSYQLAQKVRDRGIPVVLGGPHVTFEIDEAIQYADFVVRGEGEETLVELIHCLENNGDVSTILGLSYWNDEIPCHNPERPLIFDLDKLPIPDFTIVLGHEVQRVASVSTSRGCPHNCTFCSVPSFTGHGYRAHSVDRVLQEIDFHLHNFSMHYLFFADDIFNYNKKRTKGILQGMIANHLTPHWGAQMRLEAARDSEMLELMRAANCERVFVGFESINPQTLELYNKKQSVDDIISAIKTFHKNKIKIHGMFVLGSDLDSVETIKTTLKFTRRLDIDSVQFMILTPMPGSQDFDTMKQENREFLSTDWSLYDGHHVVHVPKGMTPYELQFETIRAMRKFYGWAGIVNRFVRGDLYEVWLRYSGHQLVKKWLNTNYSYIKELEVNLLKDVKKIIGGLKPKKRITIAIVESGLTEQLHKRLEIFFKELDVPVVHTKKFVGEMLEEGHQMLVKSDTALKKAVSEYVTEIQGKADYIIVPVMKDLRQYQEKVIQEYENLAVKIKSKAQSIPYLINIQTDLEFPFLRTTLTKIGLAFTEDLDKVQRAYAKAFAYAV